HKYAFDAAVAGKCVAQEGDFWKFHDKLFEAPKPDLQPFALGQAAIASEVDRSTFDACLQGAGPALVRAEIELAKEWDVRSTPTFFVGRRLPDGRLDVRQRFSGARPFEEFDK